MSKSVDGKPAEEKEERETMLQKITTEKSIYLGKDSNGNQVNIPLWSLSKHTLITGTVGSGKTNAIKYIASALWKEQKIPFLILELKNKEYRALANQKGMKELYVFAPSSNMTFSLNINPFEFPKGTMLVEHMNKLYEVFSGAFPFEYCFGYLLKSAIKDIYIDCGWTPKMVNLESTNLKLPTMSMLYTKLENKIKKSSDRSKLEEQLIRTIGSLLEKENRKVFDVEKSTIKPENWIKTPVLIELESMDTGPANFLALMVLALIRETLIMYHKHKEKHDLHMTFIDDVDRLIGVDETSLNIMKPKGIATKFIQDMLAEGNALGEGIVIASQYLLPNMLTGIRQKVGFLSLNPVDRVLLGNAMRANSEQTEAMALLSTGQALVSYEGLMKPIEVQMEKVD